MTGQMEVVGRVSGRWRWSDTEKLEILAEAFRPGVRVCDVITRREVSSSLTKDPHSGALFAFRGKRGHLVKLLWFDGQGLCLFSKRLDRGRFVWPVTATGTVTLTPAQLSMLLEGIDWRRPERTFTPTLAG